MSVFFCFEDNTNLPHAPQRPFKPQLPAGNQLVGSLGDTVWDEPENMRPPTTRAPRKFPAVNVVCLTFALYLCIFAYDKVIC